MEFVFSGFHPISMVKESVNLKPQVQKALRSLTLLCFAGTPKFYLNKIPKFRAIYHWTLDDNFIYFTPQKYYHHFNSGKEKARKFITYFYQHFRNRKKNAIVNCSVELDFTCISMRKYANVVYSKQKIDMQMNWWKCVVTRTLAKPERRSAYNMDENVLYWWVYFFFIYDKMLSCCGGCQFFENDSPRQYFQFCQTNIREKQTQIFQHIRFLLY